MSRISVKMNLGSAVAEIPPLPPFQPMSVRLRFPPQVLLHRQAAGRRGRYSLSPINVRPRQRVDASFGSRAPTRGRKLLCMPFAGASAAGAPPETLAITLARNLGIAERPRPANWRGGTRFGIFDQARGS